MTAAHIGTIPRTLAGAALVAAALLLAALPVRAQQSPSDKSLFVTASVDNDRPYLGQQITYASKIYQRSGFPHSVHYEPPGFAGFWNVRATEQDEYSETIESKVYRVIELRTLLFPSIVGTIDIEPAVLTVPDGSSEGPTVVEGVPVTIEVRPMPTEAPAGFAGAVGRFEISATVDTTTGRMNDSVQLTVTVQGAGNIDALPDPLWPEFLGWRVIGSPASVTSEVIDGRLVGSRTYASILVPEMAGELTVPEISYAYYDPDLEEYVQAATSPIVVSIGEADGVPSVPPSSAGGTEDDPEFSDTRRLRAVPPVLGKAGGNVTENYGYWASWTLPLLVIFGAAVWRRRRDALEAALVDSRRRDALPNAQSTLSRAVAAGDDGAVAAADAVLSYLADRFAEPLTGLTREALGEQLRDAGVPTEVAERVEHTMASGEAARYTPEAASSGQTEDRVQRAAQLLVELDGAIEQ